MRSEIERQFEKKEDEYKEKFGSNYPIFATSCLTFEEHIVIIDKALETGEPVKIDTEEGLVY